MATDAMKKFRDIFAFGLLAVAALYLISGLSLLLKSQNDVGLSFSGKAEAFGYLFAHPVLILCTVAAVALAVGFGEVTRNARVIVLAALAIVGLALVLALITFFASFGANEGGLGADYFGGVLGAGKIVGLLLGLAQLLLLGLATWFALTVLRGLPKASPRTSSSWGQGQGYAGAQGYGQPGWGQQDSSYGQQSGWGQQSPPGWQVGPGAGATSVGGTATGWGDQYQGQPASAWGNAESRYPESTYPEPTYPESTYPESTYAGTTEGQPVWGAPGQAAQSWGEEQPPVGGQQWGAPESGHRVERHGSTAADAAETTQWDRPTGEQEEPPRHEDEQHRQRGWWQGPRQ